MNNTELEALRLSIDEADRRLLAAFSERAEISRKIGEYKKEKGLPVLDEKREAAKLAELSALSGAELSPYTEKLYRLIFEISRQLQEGAEPGKD